MIFHITASQFYDWRERYGKVNEHNGWFPAISGWRSGTSRLSSQVPSEDPLWKATGG